MDHFYKCNDIGSVKLEMCTGQNLQERERKETRSRLKKIFLVPVPANFGQRTSLVAPKDVMKTACWVVAEGEPRSLHL